MNRRAAFTLLEALAAVVVLGLLATAVVPLLHRIGDAGVRERLQAQGMLRLLAPVTRLEAGGELPIPDHPGWTLQVIGLAAEPEPPPPAGQPAPAAPAHGWLQLRIRDRAGATLAETMVATLAPGSGR